FLKKSPPRAGGGGVFCGGGAIGLKTTLGWGIHLGIFLGGPVIRGFCATLCLNANIASLRSGGRVVGIFLIVVVGLLVMQNAIGIGMASLLGLDPLMGLLAGSITLSGGQGTGAAGGNFFIDGYVFPVAKAVARAGCNLALWLGGLVGGPGGALRGGTPPPPPGGSGG
ncbi:hypothetical protein KCA24_33225, partial [Escherichia coli]|nr:hypothetical protein [Escherichia coli]